MHSVLRHGSAAAVSAKSDVSYEPYRDYFNVVLNCDLMREDELGTLEVGKLADICVLDRDVFDLDYRDARDLAVDMTMSDGQIVFDRNKEA